MTSCVDLAPTMRALETCEPIVPNTFLGISISHQIGPDQYQAPREVFRLHWHCLRRCFAICGKMPGGLGCWMAQVSSKSRFLGLWAFEVPRCRCV